ncbi:inducible T-cell costimulator [Tiliqua scincoides]|uniref:inducible T-cell costimulator n=1 Tax=Tiliqua scincoides TaxID=71010 RepID=UPI003463490D
MKLDILSFCLLCFYFESLYGADHCSSLPPRTGSCREKFLDSNPQLNKLPRDSFIFYCPLTNTSNFHMKLFKGKDKACDLYFENETTIVNKTEFCEPVYSGCEVKFILSNLQNKHSDSYTCYLEILIPLYNICKANETYLYIQDPGHCLLSEMKSWILIGLAAFSIAVCICCFIACCLRKAICQNASPGSYDYSNEYMSMAAVKFT